MLGIDNYRCCPHNYGMGWPYYVEEMWLATPDAGAQPVPVFMAWISRSARGRGR